MKTALRCRLIFVLICLNTLRATAQDSQSHPHISVEANVGLFFGGYTSWHFYADPQNTLTKPLASFGLGIQYGPIAEIEGALLNTSVEAAFGEMRTDEHYISSGEVEMRIQRIPVMLWLTIETDHVFTPYARVAAGALLTEFRETYADPFLPSTHIHSWNLSWGYGAGLRYRYSEVIDVAIYEDNWVTEEKISQTNAWGDERGITAPYGDHAVGLRHTLHF